MCTTLPRVTTITTKQNYDNNHLTKTSKNKEEIKTRKMKPNKTKIHTNDTTTHVKQQGCDLIALSLSMAIMIVKHTLIRNL